MNNSSFFDRVSVLSRYTAFLLVTAAAMTPPAAHAVNVTEPPDFPNVTPGTPTTLTVGTNTFSGTVTTSADGQDRFNVTVPVGFQISAVTKNVTGAGSFDGNVTFNTSDMGGFGFASLSIPQPLQAGTYSCIVSANFSVGNPWTVTITLETTPDYAVYVGGGDVSITDSKGNADTASMTSSGGALLFAASGRTFSVNGGPKRANDSGNISLSGVLNVEVSLEAGADVLNIGALPSSMPNMVINGGAGDDTINFIGAITFATDRSLDVDLRDELDAPGADAINLSNDADLILSGIATATLRCSRSVSVTGGASITVGNGGLLVSANILPTATTGSFHGVQISGAGSMLTCQGSGDIQVDGRGGDGSGGYLHGVLVSDNGMIVGGTTGSLNVTGVGGSGASLVNRGVTVESGGRITSSGGPVSVFGNGGQYGTSYSIGVSVLNGGGISSGGTGLLQVTGSGGGTSGFFHQGVEVTSSGSFITSSGGSIIITGYAGFGDSAGLWLNDNATISTPAAGGIIEIWSNSMAIAPTTSITTTHPSSHVALKANSETTFIQIGGADAVDTVPVLGLTDAELDRVFTPDLWLVHPYGGEMALVEPITRATNTNVRLQMGGGTLFPYGSGFDFSLAGGRLTVDAMLRYTFGSTTPEAGYAPLVLAGEVALAARDLVLTTYSGFSGTVGDTFTLIDNDATDTVIGQFNELSEGAYALWPGSSTLAARISYIGGTGNDVTITLVPVAEALQVTTTAGSGAGALHTKLAFAARHAGPDVITFAPALNGGTALLHEWVVEDLEGVIVDASSLTAGFTIQASGPTRLFSVNDDCFLGLRGLTLMGGTVSGVGEAGLGGAILNNLGATVALTQCTISDCHAEGGGVLANAGIATLADCTLSGNDAISQGGGIYNASLGQLTVERCTFAGNTAGQYGGGIENNGTLTLRHCTFAGNTGANVGGGVDNYQGTANIAHCILAGNSAGTTSSSDMLNESGSVTRVGANIIRLAMAFGGASSTGPAPSTADPLLAPLGSYGGPTQTMALRAASPALNAATGSTAIADQRGFPIIGGTPDLGAYEAGTHTSYNAFIWEFLPSTATPDQYAASYDFDSDGSTNTSEWTAGTNPTSSASRFHISRTQRNGAYLDFDFTTVTGRYYHLETSPNLTSWTPMETVPGTGSVITRQLGPISTSPARTFVRVLVNQSPAP